MPGCFWQWFYLGQRVDQVVNLTFTKNKTHR